MWAMIGMMLMDLLFDNRRYEVYVTRYDEETQRGVRRLDSTGYRTFWGARRRAIRLFADDDTWDTEVHRVGWGEVWEA